FPPERLQKLKAGADRQWGLRAIAAGYVRRAAGFGLSLQQIWRAHLVRSVAESRAVARLRLQQLAQVCRRDLGDTRRTAPFRLFKANGLGRPRPRAEAGQQAEFSSRSRTLA